MYLQRIRNLHVQNSHPFGRELQRFCLNNMDVFPNHGFMDGGCLALTVALQEWMSMDSMAFSVGRKEVHDHIVLGTQGKDGTLIFLDGDGIGTADDLLRKMRTLESIKDAVIKPVPHLTPSDLSPFIHSYEKAGVPTELVHRLNTQIGAWDDDRVDLKYVNDDICEQIRV